MEIFTLSIIGMQISPNCCPVSSVRTVKSLPIMLPKFKEYSFVSHACLLFWRSFMTVRLRCRSYVAVNSSDAVWIVKTVVGYSEPSLICTVHDLPSDGIKVLCSTKCQKLTPCWNICPNCCLQTNCLKWL